MSDDLVLVEREGLVATLFINRPDKRNSLNPELLGQIADILESLRSEDVRCVVLRGVGEKAFSAGFDIGRIGQEGSRQQVNADPSISDPYRRPEEAIKSFPYPVIAMIYGYCVGGGLEIAATCDMRIAADNARIGITPAKLGIVYQHEPMKMFIDLIGPSYTKELFATGRLVDAQRAHTMGLLNDVIPEAELKEHTYTLARELAANAPLSVRAAKIIVNRLSEGTPLTPEEAARFEEMRQEGTASEDLKEGRKAFLEKRKPQFTDH